MLWYFQLTIGGKSYNMAHSVWEGWQSIDPCIYSIWEHQRMQKSKCSTIGRHRTQIFSHQPLSKEKKKSKITIRTWDMRFFEHIHVHVLYLHFFCENKFYQFWKVWINCPLPGYHRGGYMHEHQDESDCLLTRSAFRFAASAWPPVEFSGSDSLRVNKPNNLFWVGHPFLSNWLVTWCSLPRRSWPPANDPKVPLIIR